MDQSERRWYQRMSTRMQWVAVGVAAVLLFGVIGLMAGGPAGSPQPNVPVTPAPDGAGQGNPTVFPPSGATGQGNPAVFPPTGQGNPAVTSPAAPNPAQAGAPTPPTLPATHPPNAVALCADGSYSFATRQSDACTSQGGVRVWLRPDLPP